jgi:hypothetical protein
MKFTSTQAAAYGAAALLATQPVYASHSHGHGHAHLFEKKHSHGHGPNPREVAAAANETVEKRSAGTCSFPTGAGLVPVTPGAQNGGWAMTDNQPCLCDGYCPYACPPGQMMAQWKPGSSYATGDRMVSP